MSVQLNECPNAIREAYKPDEIEVIWASSTGPGAEFTVITTQGKRQVWRYVSPKGWRKGC